MPPGRETVVTIGAELSQWNPLMRDWLVWMRRECPRARDQRPHRFRRPADGAGAGRRARSGNPLRRPGPAGNRRRAAVRGAAGAGPHDARRPAARPRIMSTSTGARISPRAITPPFPTPSPARSRSATAHSRSIMSSPVAAADISGWPPSGLTWIGAAGARPRQPEFSYSAYAVHSTRADESVMARVRRGLRAAAEGLA